MPRKTTLEENGNGNGLSDLQDIYCPACIQIGRSSFLGKCRIIQGEVYFYCRRCKNFVGVSSNEVLAVPGLDKLPGKR